MGELIPDTAAAVAGTATGRALVTGASSGVGEAFARVLSERGYEVVLVARDRERLASVASGLAGPSRVVVADLTREPDLAAVQAQLSDREAPVDLLVNNAAAGWHGPFAEHDPDLLQYTIALNATAVLRLSRAVLPLMISRGRGSLINISSVAGSAPAADMSTYAATKAFIDNWTASMVLELRGTGVTVTCVKPGYVRSAFHKRSGEQLEHLSDAEWISPETVARRALDANSRGAASVVILPELPWWQRAQRQGTMWLVRRAPWVRDVKRALLPGARTG